MVIESDVVKFLHDALLVGIKLASPVLIASVCVGLVVSIIQTTTSIQEQTLTFVPKLVGIFVSIAVFFGYMLNTAVDYFAYMYSLIQKF